MGSTSRDIFEIVESTWPPSIFVGSRDGWQLVASSDLDSHDAITRHSDFVLYSNAITPVGDGASITVVRIRV